MILVFGKTGQVARELATILPTARFLGRDEADLTDPVACADLVRTFGPDAVINAAAFTAVDKAETDEATALLVNGDAPGAIARACAMLDVPLVHMSTDYVFDGSGDAPFKPGHPTGPLGAYGRTKRAGEQAIRASGAAHAILRTSWVFSAHGSNFVKTMLRLSETRDSLNVVADQIGGPTPARALAQACVAATDVLRRDRSLSGTYHFAGSPDVSWADFAREIFTQAGRPTVVNDIPSSAYPTPARRPQNSRLDCSGLAALGLKRPDWRDELRQTLTELEAIA